MTNEKRNVRLYRRTASASKGEAGRRIPRVSITKCYVVGPMVKERLLDAMLCLEDNKR